MGTSSDSGRGPRPRKGRSVMRHGVRRYCHRGENLATRSLAYLSLPLRNLMNLPTKTATPRIAIVVPAFGHGGGVPTVAKFLRDVLLRSGRYTCEIISLSTAWGDEHNVR